MRFHLTYEGPLYGSNNNKTRAEHKHDVRRIFHKQIKQLWNSTWLKDEKYGQWEAGQKIKAETPLHEALAEQYQQGAYRFVPLVRERVSLLCSLDILFLRSDIPGGVVASADIDNRLKTLFDALRMPGNVNELGGHMTPDPDKEPFYCLLEDDKLISRVIHRTDDPSDLIAFRARLQS